MQLLETVLVYMLMAAPSASDNHVENYAIPLMANETALECNEAKSWLYEQSIVPVPSHTWCMPVQVNIWEYTGEGEPT